MRRQKRQSRNGGSTGLHPKGNWLLQSKRTCDTAAEPAVDSPANGWDNRGQHSWNGRSHNRRRSALLRVKKLPTRRLVSRDSATRRARHLAVQFDVSELPFALRRARNGEAVSAFMKSSALRVLWLACEVLEPMARGRVWSPYHDASSGTLALIRGWKLSFLLDISGCTDAFTKRNITIQLVPAAALNQVPPCSTNCNPFV